MKSILSFTLVVLLQFISIVHGDYRINQLKHELFKINRLASFREFENQNLDENFFLSDYTKAPRHYNTNKCINDLSSILQNLQNGDRESIMCKNDDGFIYFDKCFVPIAHL